MMKPTFLNNFKANFVFKVVVVLVTFLLGWYAGVQGYIRPESLPIPQGLSTTTRPADLPFDWTAFDRVYQTLNERYVDRPLDAKKLFYGALKGMAEATGDPYTSFLPPDENEKVKESLNGRYEGIGAELGMRDNQLTVVAPLDGSPAVKAGIRAGDKITKIDDIDSSTYNLAEAVNKIRGSKGTSVKLTLARINSGKEGEPFDITITREEIQVKSVSWQDKGDGVAYVRLSRFGDSTNLEWDQAIADIIAKNPKPKSIILDLRSNPGGYLQSAVHISSEFISSGVVVSEEFGDKNRQNLSVDHKGRLIGVPIVVMLDGGSASSSEIVAGALKELAGAKFVGVKSFGKGTVQEAVDFSDSSSLHVTIAKWLTPKGENIHGKGFEPDVKVERTDDDINNNRDPQLDKSLEIAKSY